MVASVLRSPLRNVPVQRVYDFNESLGQGFFAIGSNGFWHGGVHINSQAKPIVSIAAGRVVAFRLEQNYKTFTQNGDTQQYSNNFILTHHDDTTPNGQNISFYCLYMHIRPWGEYNNPEADLPKFLRENNLFRTAGDEIYVFPVPADGEEVSAGKIGMDEVIAHAGRFMEAENDFHFEVFTDDVSFMDNPLNDELRGYRFPARETPYTFSTVGAPQRDLAVNAAVGDTVELLEQLEGSLRHVKIGDISGYALRGDLGTWNSSTRTYTQTAPLTHIYSARPAGTTVINGTSDEVFEEDVVFQPYFTKDFKDAAGNPWVGFHVPRGDQTDMDLSNDTSEWLWLSNADAATYEVNLYDWNQCFEKKDDIGLANGFANLDEVNALLEECGNESGDLDFCYATVEAAVLSRMFRNMVRKLVIKNGTEWSAALDAETGKYDILSKEPLNYDQSTIDSLKSLMAELQWWDDVEGPAELPDKKALHFFHPIAFCHHLGRLGLWVTRQQLKTIWPGASSANLEAFLTPLNFAMQKYGIDNRLRQKHFLAQVGHECAYMRYREELASGADYEGRDDLGNTQPGDGRRFKGRGFIQLTGRANYTSFSSYIGENLMIDPNPSRVATDDILTIESATWFWSVLAKINDEADRDSIDDTSKRVNGGRIMRNSQGQIRYKMRLRNGEWVRDYRGRTGLTTTRGLGHRIQIANRAATVFNNESTGSGGNTFSESFVEER